jgi:hypothetical protein
MMSASQISVDSKTSVFVFLTISKSNILSPL